VIEDGVGAVLALEGALLDVVRGVNEIAQQRLFLDDAGVVLDVGDLGHAVGESGEVGSATGGLQVSTAMHLFGERDEVNGLLGLAKRDHLGKDAAVMIEKEVFGAEILDGRVEGVVIE